MKKFTTPEFRFNEIIFQNRNKNYGAYVLRNEENYTLLKSLFAGTALVAAFSLSPLIINSFSDPVVKRERHTPYSLRPVDEPIYHPPKVVKSEPAQAPKTKTVTLEVPTPTPNAKVETPAPTVTEVQSSKIGFDNTDGDRETVINTPVLPVQPIVSDAPVTVVSNDPVTSVDVEAAFAGGINRFREKVADNFNSSPFEGSGETLKTVVTFIVERDGTISQVTAVGANERFNREAEKTLRAVRGKWTPAKLKGQNVRSYFKLPIAMQFE